MFPAAAQLVQQGLLPEQEEQERLGVGRGGHPAPAVGLLHAQLPTARGGTLDQRKRTQAVALLFCVSRGLGWTFLGVGRN